MKLFVTTFDLRPDVIRALAARACDGVELRAETGGALDLAAIRAATSKPLLLTYRGMRITNEQIEAAVAAGIDLVDVEWQSDRAEIPHRERVVLSHHDYDRVPDDLESLIDAMLARGCAETKLAVTPRNFADNQRLMAALRARPGLTLFGMGERGIFSRILAPFFGSRLAFVAPDEGSLAAPGQLTLEKATAIYDGQAGAPVLHTFALVGNPAGQSLSPTIHNPLFRQRGAAAAYTIASVERFDEVTDALLHDELRGISVTAPFKEEAYRFALAQGADIRPHAKAAEALNTLVKTPNGLVADNTDVDGFLALIPPDVERAAVIGAGGTARAAIVALQLRGLRYDVFNRTERTILGRVTRPLSEIDGDLVIDTLPGDVRLALPPVRTIAAAYNRGGIELLHEQAKRQNVLFLEALT